MSETPRLFQGHDINDVAAACADAGYAVHAVSIANTSVDVLGRETDVPARSVTKELYKWGQGRAELGDDKHFQWVAHGNAFTVMQRGVGDATLDVATPRRQGEAWRCWPCTRYVSVARFCR